MFKFPEKPKFLKKGTYAGPFEPPPYSDFGHPIRHKSCYNSNSDSISASPDTNVDTDEFYHFLEEYLFEKDLISTEVACALMLLGYDYISTVEGRKLIEKFNAGEMVFQEEKELLEIIIGLKANIKMFCRCLGVEDVFMDDMYEDE